MKTQSLFMVFGLAFVAAAADPPPPVYSQTAPPVQPAAQPPPATPAPPPAAPAKRSMADLEKLVAPIALYPDPLIATMLPASVYPLEIVQAARFVVDTNNLARLDEQPWDNSVKAVARIPDAIKKLNDDISWTIELGEAFLAQDKDIMDAIQAMRSKAQKAGTLQTTSQQIVVVTNMVVEKTVEEKVVVVTNTVVQIQPASSTVVYVPSYNPYTVYYPPPAYVYNPVAPLVTFTAGVAMGAIIANNCNWYGGGCYHGDVDIDVNRNVNNNFNRNVNNPRSPGTGQAGTTGARASTTGGQQKWQPDQSRLSKSGSSSAAASARTAEARGWGAGAGPSTGNSGARPSTGTAGARPSTGATAPRPSTGTPSANRPTASPTAARPTPSASASRPSPSPSTSPARSSSGSAYSGMSSGASARSSSSRGTASRSGGFSGGRGGGGGSRGGGGRR